MPNNNEMKNAAAKSLQTQTDRNVANDQKQTQVTFQDYCKKHQDYIVAALPRHIGGVQGVARIINIALLAVNRNPKLKECTMTSLFGALVQASQLGLEINSPLGQAYLVPFKNRGVMEAQFMPGYRGLVDLSRRSGKLVEICSNEVRTGDEFKYEFGMHSDLKHIPAAERGMKDKDISFFYAYARLKDGGFQFVVMSKFEVDKIRSRSKSSSNGPWVTDYAEMGKKTVIKRLWKLLPTSADEQVNIGAAIEADNMADRGSSVHLDDIDIGTGNVNFTNAEDADITDVSDDEPGAKKIEYKKEMTPPKTQVANSEPAPEKELPPADVVDNGIVEEATELQVIRDTYEAAGKLANYTTALGDFCNQREKEAEFLDDRELRFICDFLKDSLKTITK